MPFSYLLPIIDSNILEIIQGTITALFNDTIYKSDLWNEETTLVAGEFREQKTTTTAKTVKS